MTDGRAAPALVVLAAGVGTRFGGMKQVAAVDDNGAALLDYAVFDAVRAGFGSVVFVISDGSREVVRAHVEKGCGRHVATAFVLQDTGGRAKPWGTGHAVLSARPAVASSGFGVVNADDFYGRRSFATLHDWLAPPGGDHALVGYRLRDTLSSNGGVSRGLCRVDGDRLESVRELHDLRQVGDAFCCREGVPVTGDEPVSVNLWGFRPSFFDVLAAGFAAFVTGAGPDDEFFIGTAVNDLAARVRVLRSQEPFFGVTFRQDLPDVRRRIRALVDAGVYPDPLWP